MLPRLRWIPLLIGATVWLTACTDVERPSATSRPDPSRGAAGRPSQAPDGLVARLPSVFGSALVFDDGPWRCIAINKRSSVQSCVHRSRSLDFRYEYVQLLLTGALAVEAPKRGVLLGLGGAGIVHLLRATRSALLLDVVEIDAAVVTLAGKYFAYAPRTGEQAFVEDAAKFVKRPEQAGRFDIVFLDCFGESFIPPSLQTEAFFKEVRGLLSPVGVLVANLWSTHPRYESIVAQYGRTYPEVRLIPGRISGNTIVVASRRPLPDRVTWVKRAHALDSRKVIPFPVLPHALRLRRP